MPRGRATAQGLTLTLLPGGCSATDPALRKGIANVEQRAASALQDVLTP
jgi:hypothetical protein